MTNEQKYYSKMTPDEWRLYKLNDLINRRREGAPYMGQHRSRAEDNFNIFMLHSFNWSMTPQRSDFWRDIARRDL